MIRTGQGRPQAQTTTDSGTGRELTEVQPGGGSHDHADQIIPARPATPGAASTDSCPAGRYPQGQARGHGAEAQGRDLDRMPDRLDLTVFLFP